MATALDGTTPEMAQLWNEIIQAAQGQGADIETAMKSNDYRTVLQAAAKDNRFATDDGAMALEHAGKQVGVGVNDIFGQQVEQPDQYADPEAAPAGMGEYQDGGEEFLPPEGDEEDDGEWFGDLIDGSIGGRGSAEGRALNDAIGPLVNERSPIDRFKPPMKLGGPTNARQDVYPYSDDEEGYGYDVNDGTDGPYSYDQSGQATFNAPVVGSRRLPAADEDDPNGWQAATGQAARETRRPQAGPGLPGRRSEADPMEQFFMGGGNDAELDPQMEEKAWEALNNFGMQRYPGMFSRKGGEMPTKGERAAAEEARAARMRGGPTIEEFFGEAMKAGVPKEYIDAVRRGNGIGASR